MFAISQSSSLDPRDPVVSSQQSCRDGQQDASVHVSLMPCACLAPQSGYVGVTILGREGVTMRVGDEDWEDGDCLEYEDITEVTHNSLELGGGDCLEYEDITDVNTNCSYKMTKLSTTPPSLPPGDNVGQKDHKRKDLKAHLGLGEVEAICAFGQPGSRAARCRKDLTRFLGIKDEMVTSAGK